MSNTRIYWLHALSPTHAGSGRGVGFIDLPIDREGVTGWPIIRGSALKGVWRDRAVRQKLPNVDLAFGRAADGETLTANSGALIATDARLVCLPVRSFRGTFAWCSSPLCLQMLRRTLELCGGQGLPDAPSELADDVAHHAAGTALLEEQQIFLEDLNFQARDCTIAAAWAAKIAAWVFPGDANWGQQFQKRFVVLPDAAFDFLCETGTEVHSRVRIDDDTKTAAAGALWTEESLPAETILAGIVQCDRVFGRNGEDVTPAALLDRFAKDPLILQIGGKATIGRGQMRCVFTELNGGGR